MALADRQLWAAALTLGTEELPEPNKTQRRMLLGESLAKIRPRTVNVNRRLSAAGDNENDGSEGRDLNYMKRILNAKTGVGPDVAYDLGEALFEKGICWSSGLLFLALSTTFQPHAVGTIGHALADGPTDVLKAAWQPTMRILATNVNSLPDTLEFYGRDSLKLPAEARHRYREGWESWKESRENTTALPDVFRAYFSLARTPFGSRISGECFSIISSARSSLISWMRRVEHEWSDYGPQFLEPEGSESYINTSDIISGSDLTPYAEQQAILDAYYAEQK
jgi:hypothetical protein